MSSTPKLTETEKTVPPPTEKTVPPPTEKTAPSAAPPLPPPPVQVAPKKEESLGVLIGGLRKSFLEQYSTKNGSQTNDLNFTGGNMDGLSDVTQRPNIAFPHLKKRDGGMGNALNDLMYYLLNPPNTKHRAQNRKGSITNIMEEMPDEQLQDPKNQEFFSGVSLYCNLIAYYTHASSCGSTSTCEQHTTHYRDPKCTKCIVDAIEQLGGQLQSALTNVDMDETNAVTIRSTLTQIQSVVISLAEQNVSQAIVERANRGGYHHYPGGFDRSVVGYDVAGSGPSGESSGESSGDGGQSSVAGVDGGVSRAPRGVVNRPQATCFFQETMNNNGNNLGAGASGIVMYSRRGQQSTEV